MRASQFPRVFEGQSALHSGFSSISILWHIIFKPRSECSISISCCPVGFRAVFRVRGQLACNTPQQKLSLPHNATTTTVSTQTYCMLTVSTSDVAVRNLEKYSQISKHRHAKERDMYWASDLGQRAQGDE
eukprot:2736735-Amphidinium_carterae.1